VHWSNTHWLKFKTILGREFDNLAMLVALNLTLMLIVENGAYEIQLFGDSQVVMKCMKGTFNYENFRLCPTLYEILAIKSTFLYMYFHDIYRERNEFIKINFGVGFK